MLLSISNFVGLQSHALSNTCLELPLQPHTLRVALCRHNVVVDGIFSEPLREGDGRRSTLGGGSVPVDQVGVGWLCTIVNGAGVPWLKKCALHNDTCCVGSVDVNHKVNIPTTYGKRSFPKGM